MAQLEDVPDSDPLPPAAEVSISFEARSALIHLSGEVDLTLREGLEFAAQEAILRTVPVTVDLSSVTFMDSAGVAFLAALVRAGAGSGWRLAIIGPSQLILDTLTVSGLLPVLDVLTTSRRPVTNGC